MDVLSEVLAAIRLRDAVFLDVKQQIPWPGENGRRQPADMPPGTEGNHVIVLHAITHGEYFCDVPDIGNAPLHLQAGDILVLPRADKHMLRALPSLCIGKDDMDGSSAGRQLVSAYFRYDARPFNPVLESLPPHFRVPMPDSRECLTLCRLAVREAGTMQTGRETILLRLAELLLMAALRRYIDALPLDARSWLSGLRDPHIGAALKLMHERSEEDWSVKQLARHVGLSRSVFASRFQQFVGLSPIQYLTKWRIHRATHLLERQGTGVSEVAVSVGYDSDAAFCRSFKRVMGVSPGLWRRDKRA